MPMYPISPLILLLLSVHDGLTYNEVKQALQEFVLNLNVPTCRLPTHLLI